MESRLRSKKQLLIKNVNVVPMPGNKLLRNRDVWIEGNKITAITKADRSKGQPAKSIDASGKYLIPGLFDMHVHLHSKSTFPLFLMHGITAIREMGYSDNNRGDIFKIREQVATGQVVGPRLFICGPILEGNPPLWSGFFIAKTAVTGRQMVKKLKKQGVDFIKVYHTLKPTVYRAILSEAKLQNLKVVGHIPVGVSPIEALKLGQVGLEHMHDIRNYAGRLDLKDAVSKQYLGWKVFKKFTIQRQPLERVKQALAKKDSYLCPTLVVSHQISQLDKYQKLRASQEARYLPKVYRESYWDPANLNSSVNIRGLKPLYFKNLRVILDGAKKLPAMLSKHTTILAGSDTANPFVIPGFSLIKELELLSESGLKPYQVLETATYNGAKFLNILHELGTIEEGKVANLVLLGKNPLQNISNVRTIEATILKGAFYPTTTLKKRARIY